MSVSPGVMEDNLKPVINKLFDGVEPKYTAFEVMNDTEAAKHACIQVMKNNIGIEANKIDTVWHVWFNTPMGVSHHSSMEFPVAVSECLYEVYVGENNE